MSIKRAVTFGVKYRDEDHPKLGKLAHPDGYIVVEVEQEEDLRPFLGVVCGYVQRFEVYGFLDETDEEDDGVGTYLGTFESMEAAEQEIRLVQRQTGGLAASRFRIEQPGSENPIAYAFDYDLEEFEAPGGSAERYHPKGRLATFSARPQLHTGLYAVPSDGEVPSGA